MLYKFLFAFLLVGAFIQVSSQSLTEDKGIVDDLIEKAKQAIAKIQEFLLETINDAIKYFEEVKQQITEQGNQAIENVKQKLEEIIKDAKNQIEKIKEQAAAAGVNIGDCLAENDKAFEQFLQKFLQNEIDCVQNEINEVLRIVNESLKIVTDAYNSVKDLPDKLQSCERNISCIKNVIVEVTKLQANLPGQITQKVEEVTKFVSGLKARIEICAATQLGAAGISAAEIVKDVAICAADKIAEQ